MFPNSEMSRLRTQDAPRLRWLVAPLTSPNWNGNARSTTAKTKIDLSTEFGLPANIKAVYLYVAVRDSGSAAGDPALILGPGSNPNEGMWVGSGGKANDSWERQQIWVPCNTDGDIYFQAAATGALTLDAYVWVWGYQY